MVCLNKFFKGCLPQILLGPLLNTLSQIREGLVSSMFLEIKPLHYTLCTKKRCTNLCNLDTATSNYTKKLLEYDQKEKRTAENLPYNHYY